MRGCRSTPAAAAAATVVERASSIPRGRRSVARSGARPVSSPARYASGCRSTCRADIFGEWTSGSTEHVAVGESRALDTFTSSSRISALAADAQPIVVMRYDTASDALDPSTNASATARRAPGQKCGVTGEKRLMEAAQHRSRGGARTSRNRPDLFCAMTRVTYEPRSTAHQCRPAPCRTHPRGRASSRASVASRRPITIAKAGRVLPGRSWEQQRIALQLR